MFNVFRYTYKKGGNIVHKGTSLMFVTIVETVIMKLIFLDKLLSCHENLSRFSEYIIFVIVYHGRII